MYLLRLILTVATIACASSAAIGQTSKDFAAMGVATWAAFECSALAAHSKDSSRQERLFIHGYTQGQKFIAAVIDGKVESKDLRAEVPIGLLLLLEGPSVDFMLGRIYENAQENALKDVFKTKEEFNSEDRQVILAKSKFHKGNCALIGVK